MVGREVVCRAAEGALGFAEDLGAAESAPFGGVPDAGPALRLLRVLRLRAVDESAGLRVDVLFPRFPRDAFERVAKKASPPRGRITAHTMRHTFATWLADEGTPPAEIADLLGDTISVVIETYCHSMPGARDRASVGSRPASPVTRPVTRRPCHLSRGPPEGYRSGEPVIVFPKRERAMTILWIWLVPS